MQSPYYPYEDLRALCEAAGVPFEEFERYSTPVLLRMAADRRGGSEPRRSANPREREREPMVTRTTRLPHSLDVALEKKAKKAGMSASRAVAALIKLWVEDS